MDNVMSGRRRDAVEVDPREALASFVVPVLNGERDIGRCLRSIRALDWPSDKREVIVIDNGSSDGTLEVIRELGFSYIVQPGVSVGAVRNRGVAISRGRFVAFVDADVELSRSWLKAGVPAFDNESVVAVGCFPRIPDGATWVQKAWDAQQRGRQGSTRTAVAWLPSMNLLVRRETFLEVGGFDEELETAEDVDLCYRMGKCGTILRDPRMDAVHWGEAPDLATFWRKEVWRGTGNLQGISRHGFRLDEFPSVAYPLYVIFSLSVFVIGSGIGMGYSDFRVMFISLVFLSLPAMILAIRTSFRSRQFRCLLHLIVIYLVYGVARAYSVVRAPFRSSGARQ